jgi:hypothetical protein
MRAAITKRIVSYLPLWGLSENQIHHNDGYFCFRLWAQFGMMETGQMLAAAEAAVSLPFIIATLTTRFVSHLPLLGLSEIKIHHQI